MRTAHAQPSERNTDSRDDDSDYGRLLDLLPRKRIHIVLQNESAECGLACVAMIASFYGIDTSLHALRTSFPTTGRGMTLAQLIDVASSVELASRPVKFELENLRHLRLPCVLHWKMKHYVVLTEVGRKYIEVLDPKYGRQKISIADAGEFITGVALELQPGANIKRRHKPDAISLRALAGSVEGLGKGVAQILMLALLLELLLLIVPQHLRITVDQVLPYADSQLLHLLGFTFAVALVLRAGVEGIRQWMLIWLSSNINIGWTGNMFDRLLRLPLDYFGKRQLGDIIARFSSITAIQQTLTTSFVLVVIDGVMAIGSIALLIYYSPKLTLIAVGFSCAYGLARVVYLKAYEEITQRQVLTGALQQGELIETLRGIITIRLNNKGSMRMARFMNATAGYMNAGVIYQRLDLAFGIVTTICTGGQRIVVLWVGGLLAMGGSMTAGALVVFVIYSDQFTRRFVTLADYLVQFKLLRYHAERLADIALSAPEKYVDSKLPTAPLGTDIRFHEVDFAYGYGAPKILDKCSFSVGEGEVVAITGPSGAGKSTIAKLLLGIHDPQSGHIAVGGIDTRVIGKRMLRNGIACVLQDDHLFAGSLFENISFFDDEAEREDVVYAAKLAKIADDIEKMPMGYNTPIGDMGSTLSGGQVQRVLLARAFYKKPRILVLDEATSQLDLANEKLISEAVREAGVTTVLIAHRPQTFNSADRVLEFGGGRIFVKRPSSNEADI